VNELLSRWRSRFFMGLFTWSGSKLFDVIAVYSPDEDKEGDLVRVVHFAESEELLRKSAQAIVDGDK
jgi:hypothetical protein